MDSKPRSAEDKTRVCVAIVDGYRSRTEDMDGDVRAVSAQELGSTRHVRLWVRRTCVRVIIESVL
jgi:hypothetical protein